MIGTSLGNRYEITELLGRGGMGVVYRARDPLLHREVAVKVLSAATFSEESEERFRREARVVAQMDHPTIVPIYDIGEYEDSIYYVMPVVNGMTLMALIRDGSLALGDTLEIIAQAAEALDYSHQRGVIHRDVKPENIMVSREDDALRVRMMDFGLAIETTVSRLTQPGGLPGTLAYLSPEQVLAAEVDGRSDIYSLGTVLYECLVGEPPFTGSRYALLYRIVHDQAPRPGRRGVDAQLEQIVLACLSKEPAKRPERGNDLAQLLRDYAAGLEAERREQSAVRPLSEGSRERLAGDREPGVLLPLVGRRQELAELKRCLYEAEAGECQLALIGGDVGMGKTRLLHEIEQEARSRGMRVLQGRFSDESAFPYQAFGELIQDLYRGRGPLGGTQGGEHGQEHGDGHGSDLQDLLPDLLRLFPALAEIPALRSPEIGDTPPRIAVDQSGDRTRLFELLARTLTRLAGGEPAVFMLENLHRTEASIEALQYVLRRLGPTPTLIVGTYRQTEIPRRHPLTRLVRAAKDDPRIASIVLGALSPEEIHELVMTLIGNSRLLGEDPQAARELSERLYEATEGNPFFTQELVRSLIDAGEVPPSSPSSSPGTLQNGTDIWTFSGTTTLSVDALPETIQQVVEGRLEKLPESLLDLLEKASILGRNFAFEDLRELVIDAFDSDDELDESVDRLIREGILHEDRQTRGDTLHFANGVVRDVLYGKLSRRRRRLLHRRHATALEERYAGRLERVYPQLVHHFTAADMSAKTVEYALLLARESLDTFGAEAAIRATRTALELAEDEEVDRSAEGELRHVLASALYASGSLEAAFKEASRAARTLDHNGDIAGAAGAALVAARTAWQMRKVGETTRWVEKGIQLARSALGQTSSWGLVSDEDDAPSASDAAARGTLRQLLLLAATTANLRGEYQRARICHEEADELLRLETDHDEELPTGGTLITSLPQPLTTLDPALFETMEDGEVLGSVFETLLRTDADGNLVAGLCEAWESLDGARGFRLTLNARARFSNGRPLVAGDVKLSLENAAVRGSYLTAAGAAIRGLAAVRHGEAARADGIEVIDDRVLHFHLEEPLSIFPALLTDLKTAICFEDDGAWLGTGPFRLLHHDRDRVILEANSSSWRGSHARLDRIELRTSIDAAGTATGLRMGELDLGRDLLLGDIEEILRDPRFRTGLVEAPQKNTYFVVFNARGPIAQHAAVRRALSGVIRPQELVWRTLGRLAQPATCVIPPGILGHDPGRRRLPLSREQARGLLRSVELTWPIRLVAAIHPLFFDRYSSLLLALFDEWAELGVEVAIETTSMEDYLGRWQDNEEIDLLIGRWVPDYDDPDNVIYIPFHSRHGHLGGGLPTNSADLLMEKARHENRTPARQALYRKIEGLLDEQCAVLPLFHSIDYRVAGPRVRGLRFLSSPPYLNYSEIAKLPRDSRLSGMTLSSRQASTVRVPLPRRFDDLDPVRAIFLEPAEVVPNIFETLTRLGENARIAPGLTSEIRSEEAARRFRFRLRGDVRFHDGRQLTVRDVRYTFERALRQPDTRPDQALLSIRGARAWRDHRAKEIAGFEIVSASEFVIDLEEPMSFFPAMLSRQTLGIVPEGTHTWNGTWRDGCVGTGPFRVTRFVPGETVELEANPHYWRRGYPRSDHLVFELGLDTGRILDEFRDGHFSLASHLRPNDVEAMRRQIGFSTRYFEAPGLSTYYLVFNCRRPPFDDPELRHAFARAFDFATITRATVGRLAIPAHGLVPPGLLGYEAPRGAARRVVHDPRLLGLELEVVAHPVFDRTHSAFWAHFARTATAIGLRFNVRFLDSEELVSEQPESSANLALSRWFADYPDSNCFFELFLRTGGLEGVSCGNAELDRLIERGRVQADPALRHAIYRDIEQTFARDALIVPLFHEQVYRFHRPELEGLRLRFGCPEVLYEELSLVD